MKLAVLLLSLLLFCGCQQQDPREDNLHLSTIPMEDTALIHWEEEEMTLSCQLSSEEVISKKIEDAEDKKHISEMLSEIYYEELGYNPQTGGQSYIVDVGEMRFVFNREVEENLILVFIDGEGDHYLNQSWAGLSYFFEEYLFCQDLMENEEITDAEVILCGYPLKEDMSTVKP